MLPVIGALYDWAIYKSPKLKDGCQQQTKCVPEEEIHRTTAFCFKTFDRDLVDPLVYFQKSP